MKTIFSSVKHSYLAKIGMLLIVVALVAAIISCEPGDTYDLTMAENPAEGGTATDETGGSPYGVLEIVNITAVPNPCYQFVNWEASAGIFGNATAAETTFLMPAEDVTVTANFEPVPPDHYKFYFAEWQGGEPPEKLPADVQLVDQFGTFNATVGEAYWFGNPVEKVHGDMVTPISDPDRHYTIYDLDYEEGWEPQSWQVTVKNQFGENQELTVQGPFYLAVPTQKEDHEMVECLDHLLVYEVIPPLSWLEEPIAVVELNDQFLDEPVVPVWDPAYFANPVKKTIVDTGEVTEIEDPDLHYVYYYIEGEPVEKRVQILNQFGNQTLDVTYSECLAVPSQKIDWEQPLDHFKGYWAEWAAQPPMYEVPVQLEDQFVTINATVLEPYLFANPVGKWYDEGVGTPISDPRNHLTFYDIVYGEDPQIWEVEVTNQFGIDQLLLVGGPFWLAVPTTKADHGEPVDLDHFLVYEVLDYDYEYGEVEVYLWDQFINRSTWVDEPTLFANPVQKTDASGVTEIKGDEHLVFYWITSGDFLIPELPIANQFGPQWLYVYEGYKCECEWNGYDILGLPSEKGEVSGPLPPL